MTSEAFRSYATIIIRRIKNRQNCVATSKAITIYNTLSNSPSANDCITIPSLALRNTALQEVVTFITEDLNEVKDRNDAWVLSGSR